MLCLLRTTRPRPIQWVLGLFPAGKAAVGGGGGVTLKTLFHLMPRLRVNLAAVLLLLYTSMVLTG
jgi:hypothetical protein